MQQVGCAVEEVLRVGGAGRSIFGVARTIQHGRVKPIPPGSGSIASDEIAIVGHACEQSGGVAVVADLEPIPVLRGEHFSAEAQSTFVRQRLPGADDVTLRAHGRGVPGLKARVPAIKAIVMVCERDEVPCACALVEVQQLGRIPVGTCPGAA